MPSELQAQALASTPEALGFTGVPLYVSSFTDKVSRIRHVQATFKVTNTSGRTLENLSFLPVVTSDTDGDPSNNATAPTINGTPFRSVQYFDGSDASARAAALTLGAGQRLDLASGKGVIDPAASPFRTGLDISQVVPAAPVGLSAAALSFGWQVAPALAPGESTNVTFAVDIQNVDLANPKADPYDFRLLFTAAEDRAGTVAPGRPISPALLRGTVADTALFGGKAVLVNGVSQPYTTYNASAQVGESGSVELPLVTVPPRSDFFRAIPPQGDPCTYSGSVSDSSLSIASYAGLLASSPGGDPVATIQEALVNGASVNGAIVGRVYSDGPLELHGKVNCSNRIYSITYDLGLRAGWNAVEVSGNNSALVFRTLSPEARSVLQVTRRTPGVTAALDDNGVINLKPGERVQRSATLLQVGGYSGTVRLSTNVPGVSVEPASVNLASLGTQSLGGGKVGAQSLSTPLTFVGAADAPAHQAYSFEDALIFSDSSGNELGRNAINVSLVIPGVNASLNNAYLGFNVSQGETAALEVQLYSVNGLNGPVTVSLDGLPQGVSAEPQTVQVTPGGSTTARVPLHVSSGASLGSTSFMLLTSPANQSTYGTQSKLTVLPARVSLGGAGVSAFYPEALYPAASGVWVVGQQNYSTHSTPVIRYIDGVQQTAASFTVPAGYAAQSFIAGRAGTLIASRTDGNQFFVDTLRDDGSVQNVTTFQNRAGFTGQHSATDAQGRVWFVDSQYSSPGSLGRYGPDGQTDTFDGATSYSTQNTFRISNSGQWLVIRQDYSSQPLVRIDTVTGALSTLSATLFSEGQFIVADDGTVWFSSSASGYAGYLRRLNLDGSVTDFSNVPVDRLVGFDKTSPALLWLSASQKLTRFSPSDGVQTTVAVQDTAGFVTLDPQGGVDYVSSQNSVYFLSRVK
ncbi:hypothetical protein [Deinococcus sp. UYEF24]